jgi:hypothetical protein
MRFARLPVSGHYESDYFNNVERVQVSKGSSIPITRLRAIIQDFNTEFAEIIERNGHKYQISMDNESLSTRIASCPKYERLSSEIAAEDPRKCSPNYSTRNRPLRGFVQCSYELAAGSSLETLILSSLGSCSGSSLLSRNASLSVISNR